MAKFDPVSLASTGVQVFYAALAVAAIVAVYYLYRWLKGIYVAFTGPNTVIEGQITNMFTPHREDGTVDPVDIAPKGTDPIDWLFMDHKLSEAI